MLVLSFVRFSLHTFVGSSTNDSHQATGLQEQTTSPRALRRICSFTVWLPPSITDIPRLRYMRPFVFFSFFSAATFVVADTQELIDNTDKRISYSDGWKFVSPHATRMEAKPSSFIYGPLRKLSLELHCPSTTRILVQRV